MIPSDWIRIVIDSYFDKRSAYEFDVNPVGVKSDRYYFNDGQVFWRAMALAVASAVY